MLSGARVNGRCATRAVRRREHERGGKLEFAGVQADTTLPQRRPHRPFCALVGVIADAEAHVAEGPLMVLEAVRAPARDRLRPGAARADRACGAWLSEDTAAFAFAGFPVAVSAADPHPVFLEARHECAGGEASHLLHRVSQARVSAVPAVSADLVDRQSADVCHVGCVGVCEAGHVPVAGLAGDRLDVDREDSHDGVRFVRCSTVLASVWRRRTPRIRGT